MTLVEFIDSKEKGSTFWLRPSDIGMTEQDFAEFAESAVRNGALGAPAEIVKVHRESHSGARAIDMLQLHRP